MSFRRTVHMAGNQTISVEFSDLYGPDERGNYWVPVRGVYNKATNSTRLTLQAISRAEAEAVIGRGEAVRDRIRERKEAQA